jgi:hypothetical protein
LEVLTALNAPEPQTASTNGAPEIQSVWADSGSVDVSEAVGVLVAATDPDGDPLTYLYEQISGPGEVAFGKTGAITSYENTVTFTAPGNYVISVKVSDGETTVSDVLEITVGPVAAEPVDEDF